MKYIATVKGVQEVSLLGHGSPQPWEALLAEIGLKPFLKDGRVEVGINVASLRWMGKRFRELLCAVVVADRHESSKRGGYFLFAALHSSRILAGIERSQFKTPHRAGEVTVQSALPAGFEASMNRSTVVQVRMSGGRDPVRSEPEGWELPIYLPPRPGDRPGTRHVFWGRANGHTEAYAFQADTDQVLIQGAAGWGDLGPLLDADLTYDEWQIRSDATHARSKTVREPVPA